MSIRYRLRLTVEVQDMVIRLRLKLHWLLSLANVLRPIFQVAVTDYACKTSDC